RQHAKDAGQRSTQDRHLEGYRNKRRPTVEWLAADIQGIVPDLQVVLHEVTTKTPDDAANQNNERHFGLVVADGLEQILDRKGRITVNPTIARLIRVTRRRHQFGRTVELGHKAI